MIRPPAPLNIGRTEKDPEELERVYRAGRDEMQKRLPALRRCALNAPSHGFLKSFKKIF